MGWNVDEKVKAHDLDLTQTVALVSKLDGSCGITRISVGAVRKSFEQSDFRYTVEFDLDNYKNYGDGWLEELSRSLPSVVFTSNYVCNHEEEGQYILVNGKRFQQERHLWLPRFLAELPRGASGEELLELLRSWEKSSEPTAAEVKP
jgi:hypothetical protein